MTRCMFRIRFLVIVLCTLVLFPIPCILSHAGQDKGAKTWTVKLNEGAKDVRDIELKSGEHVQVILTGLKKGDVDLYVYDPQGTLVAKDVTIGPDGFVVFKTEKSGKYKIEVRNLGTGDNTSTILVDTVPSPPVVWAVEMPAWRRYTRAVSLTKGTKVVVTLTGKNKKSDVDLFVIHGHTVVAKDDSVGPDGKVEFAVPESGVYQIAIRNVSREPDVSNVEVRIDGEKKSYR
jgi:hypothetical protein